MFFIYVLTQHLIASFKIITIQNTNKQTKHKEKNSITSVNQETRLRIGKLDY